MSYWNITLEIPHAQADAFGDALIECGALSVDLADAHEGTPSEMPIFAEPGSEAGLWALCRLRALLPSASDARSIVQQAAAVSGYAAADFAVESSGGRRLGVGISRAIQADSGRQESVGGPFVA